jgi:hypothetical protein
MHEAFIWKTGLGLDNEETLCDKRVPVFLADFVHSKVLIFNFF